MSRADILSRLAAGERLLLDGATGSELQRRGVNVSQGVTPEGGLGAWSATALRDAPDRVKEVHEDYLRVGADIITTNSFWTNRFRLEMVGLAGQAEEYTRLAAVIACEARDRINANAYVAGSLAPPGMGVTELYEEYRRQAAALAAGGVDLILLEYVSSIAEAVQLVPAAATTGVPVFLGICELRPDGTMRYGDTVEQLHEALADVGVDGVLAMCSKPENISVILPKLRNVFDKPFGAYAEVGYRRASQPANYPERQWHILDDSFCPPERYRQFAHDWITMGAQIVGACCGSTPAHIAVIQPIVQAA
jgi:homocysteine S-methyltransferase